MKIEVIPISEIVPYLKNPRKNDKAVDIVAKSIKEFGFNVPILLDKNNVIIAGHTRLKAAQKLGLTEVPIIWLENLTEEQARAFRIMDNKTHEYADWNIDILREELNNLKDLGFDLELTGFDNRELTQLLRLGDAEQFDPDAEKKKIKPEEIRPKSGDIWKLGEHKLGIGNATDKSLWEKLMQQETFDFMFTDPPYKLAYTQNRFKGYIFGTKKGFGFRGQRKYEGVDMAGGVPEFDEWLSIAKEYKNPSGSNVLIFENWKNTPDLWQSMAKYWKIKNMIIWWLPNRAQGFGRKYFLFNKYDVAILGDDQEKPINEEMEEAYEEYMKSKGEKFVNSYEVGIYGQLGNSAFNRKKKTETAKVSDHITWSADTESASGQNVVFGTKPIQILISYIKVLSNINEIIMEPFCGSGSTMIASEIIGRKCRAIEMSPLHGEVILRRWEKFTGKKAEKILQT